MDLHLVYLIDGPVTTVTQQFGHGPLSQPQKSISVCTDCFLMAMNDSDVLATRWKWYISCKYWPCICIQNKHIWLCYIGHSILGKLFWYRLQVFAQNIFNEAKNCTFQLCGWDSWDLLQHVVKPVAWFVLWMLSSLYDWKPPRVSNPNCHLRSSCFSSTYPEGE